MWVGYIWGGICGLSVYGEGTCIYGLGIYGVRVYMSGVYMGVRASIYGVG